MKRRIRLDGEKPSEKALHLLEHMLSTIKGQDKAVKDLADAVEVFESGVFTENRPIYVGLCCGPSGVGKTLTAELLAEFWFGDRKAFTKIACEEFSESHRVSELKGSPAGYLGHWNPKNPHDSGTPPILWQENIDKYALEKDPELERINEDCRDRIAKILQANNDLAEQMIDLSAFLNDKGEVDPERYPEIEKLLEESLPLVAERDKMLVEIRRLGSMRAYMAPKRPKSIILFDEIEKAHPALHNILLSIMDKGEFQLANGMVTDFSNSVIIMTTNVGSHKIAEILNPKNCIGFSKQTAKQDNAVLDKEIYKQSMEELRKAFPPEFLARVDRISVYRPLSREVLRDIIDVELRKFQDKVLKSFPIVLSIDEKVKEFILKEAADKPENGARLVKNKIYKYLRKPICRFKNNGQIKEHDTLYVMLENSRIVFEKDEERRK